MCHKSRVNIFSIFILLLAIIGLSPQIGLGQAPPDFVQSLENKIQQESQTGMLNQKQTSKLQKKEAQLRLKIGKDINKHGGRLTPDEMHSLAKKAKALNRSVNEQVNKNNQDAVGTPTYQSEGQGGYGQPAAGNHNWNGNNSNIQPALRNSH